MTPFEWLLIGILVMGFYIVADALKHLLLSVVEVIRLLDDLNRRAGATNERLTMIESIVNTRLPD